MSSQTLTIVSGDSYAVINLVGSALVGLRFGKHELIPETDLGPKVFAGTLLTPWPNRIQNGAYQFEGKQYQLEIRDGKGNALHGMVDEQRATVLESRPGYARLETFLVASEGYPANLRVESVFELSATELTVSYQVTNQGPGNAPVGIGTHPYFHFTDSTKIEINAKTAAVHDSQMIPIGEVSTGDLGLGPGRASLVSNLKLDTQFCQLGDPVATITNDEFAYDIWQQDANWLMVYNTTVFPWATGPGNAIAIEAQTCPADAFNTGEDLRVLASGESTSMRWGVRLRG
jgi:aldose 1-epimerase